MWALGLFVVGHECICFIILRHKSSPYRILVQPDYDHVNQWMKWWLFYAVRIICTSYWFDISVLTTKKCIAQKQVKNMIDYMYIQKFEQNSTFRKDKYPPSGTGNPSFFFCLLFFAIVSFFERRPGFRFRSPPVLFGPNFPRRGMRVSLGKPVCPSVKVATRLPSLRCFSKGF
jgi:hypothetical protein